MRLLRPASGGTRNDGRHISFIAFLTSSIVFCALALALSAPEANTFSTKGKSFSNSALFCLIGFKAVLVVSAQIFLHFAHPNSPEEHP